jgi:5'-deoxynucleotidase YfbR-like HD superfamily hydrolase/biotin operon repressor
MQPIDPADPRRPYVKVAASIRAAILNGELEPGTRLPSIPELTELFGVSASTVNNAVRTLRDEGYVRSKGGSGNYVEGKASQPVAAEEIHPLSGTAAFLFEMGHLKHTARAGWLLLGIPQPETVAEHSFRVAMVGMAMAALEGADAGHVAALCLMHDAHESRIGDVPSVGRAYTTTAVPEAINAHQTAGMPEQAAKVFQDLVAEYEATETIESKLAHDADKIETLLQAAEYEAQGYKAGPWRDTSLQALRTDVAKQLAQAINSSDPHAWWSSFAASYHELRAAAQKRSRSE